MKTMRNLFLRFSYIILVAMSSVLGKRPNNNTTLATSTAKPFSDLLSKFHQNDYKLIFERTELVRSNASFGNVHFRTFKYNRTTPVVNATFIFTVDLGNDLEIIAQAYKFASNEYRLFPIRFQLNFCDIISRDIFGMTGFAKKGNLVCPFVKGKKYYFYNFTPDQSKFPPLIPSAKYMMEFQVMYHSEEVFVLNNYGTIDRPLSYS